MAPTRRQVMKGGVAAGAAAAVVGPQLLTRSASAVTNSLPGANIPKYQTNLFILPAMPPVPSVASRDTFQFVARRFQQQVLPAGFPATTVQGFGHPNGTLNRTPAPVLEHRADHPSQVTWTNGLMAANDNFLPQLFPVDPTLHWSNPPGGVDGRDSQPTFTETPGPYTGPHTLIVHHHGSHDFQESDGYPESWYLPNANNIPAGFARVGSFYDQFKQEALDRWGVRWPTGSLISVYPNDQRAATLWFHDHSLGTTRLGPHSGLLGFSILRGGPSDLPAGVLPGPAPKAGDPPGTKYYEILCALTNHSYNSDGSVFFPSQRLQATPPTDPPPHPGPFIPFTDLSPIWNPTRVGDAVEVNGNTWPKLTVEARRYRFRFLAGANILPWRLKVVSAPANSAFAVPFWVIGSDGGFLPQPVELSSASINRALEMWTSERYDTIIDFTGVTPGTQLFLINEAGAAGTTREVMRFDVIAPTGPDTSTPPDQLSLPGFNAVGNPTNVRSMSQNQIMSTDFPTEVREFQLGTIDPSSDDSTNVIRQWADPVTETPRVNTIEQWEFHNRTAGNHAIHVHLVEFQLVNRQNRSTGAITGPLPWEIGDKDTIVAPPGTITRIKALYDRKVRMVWHCHFVDHEDHAMMRPMQVI
jgi:FtsP/CotA-like multicopper oxidase with cupredoxin domain